MAGVDALQGRGKKRKRSVRYDIRKASFKMAGGEHVDPDRMSKLQKQLKQRQVHKAEKEMRRALKKVKVFEQRKVGRALKSAKDDVTMNKKTADALTIKELSLDVLTKEALLFYSSQEFSASSTEALAVNPRASDIRLRMIKHPQVAEAWTKCNPDSQRDPTDLTAKPKKPKTPAPNPNQDNDQEEWTSGEVSGDEDDLGRRKDVVSEFVTMGKSGGKKRRVPGLVIEHAEQGVLVHDKKNRPGQRARRALAEKLYGQEAKHLGAQHWSDQDNQSLHPSWAAKKKHKQDVDGFQGSKITFGEPSKVAQHPKQKIAKPPTKKRPTAGGKPNTSLETFISDAHPSWAAKEAKKRQESGAKFQGQKITFD